MPSNCAVEKTLESLLDCKKIKPVNPKGKSMLNIHWKDWYWSWNSDTLATWCEELIHWKRPWCWERLKAGGERYCKGWDGWMASLIQWTWVWASSGKWWWIGKPGMLQSVGSQWVGQDWGTEQQQSNMWSEIYLWLFTDTSKLLVLGFIADGIIGKYHFILLAGL